MKIKDMIKICLFFVLLVLVFLLLVFLLVPSENLLKFGYYKMSKYDILQEKTDTIDVVAIGDSTIYSSISPMEIWNNYGISMYDVAEPAQIMVDTVEALEVVYDSQHPKIVIMEASVLFRDPSKSPRQQKTKRVIRAARNLVTLMKLHSNWKKINFQDGYSVLNPNKGYVFIPKTKPGNNKGYMKQTNKEEKILDFNKEYFIEIINFCREKNIELILVAMPAKIGWNYQRHNSIVKFANEYNIDFIDFNINNLVSIDWTTDTKDMGKHLNYKGAKKVSDYLGQYLTDLNEVEDHRGDPEYSSWDRSYELYLKNMETEIIRNKYAVNK